jgi:alpha-tubulin suppressor-like RCC1 family protein
MALPQVSFIGTNSQGQCTLPPNAGHIIPVPTVALFRGGMEVRVAVGTGFTLLLADDDNLLFVVGNNHCGQLGRGHSDNDDPDNRVPRPVTGFGPKRIITRGPRSV